MSEEVYEIVALAARYFFVALALFVMIVAWRAGVRDRRAAKIRRDWSVGGFVGEFSVLESDNPKLLGARIPIPREGVLGSGRSCDARVTAGGVLRRHFAFEKRVGCLVLTPFPGAEMEETLLRDGDALTIGGTRVALALYDVEDARAKDEQTEEATPWPDDEPHS